MVDALSRGSHEAYPSEDPCNNSLGSKPKIIPTVLPESLMDLRTCARHIGIKPR